MPGRSPGNAATSARCARSMCGICRVCAANSLACQGLALAMLRSPTHAPSLHWAGVPVLHFRNEHSHHTQTKAPLGASAAGAGLILPPHRKAPHSPPTPLWRGFLHPASGTIVRSIRKPRPLWACLRWGQVLSFPCTGKPLTANLRPSGGDSCTPLRERIFALCVTRPLPAEKDRLRHLLTVC